jgi:hypothetical protein
VQAEKGHENSRCASVRPMVDPGDLTRVAEIYRAGMLEVQDGCEG